MTGGAGFIGSHLCERLLREGHDVICLDNFFTGRRENVFALLGNPRFELVRHDVIEPVLLEVDQIYNLACPASPVYYQYNPVKTVKTSVMGMINMLGLAKRVRARILQASTSEVYGDPEVHPQPESYWGNVNPIGIRSCFSADTEVLTKSGWKFFTELSLDDEIATLTKEHTIEYHRPDEIIKQRYIGELIHFQNHNSDLLVTPNHKMYVQRRDRKDFELVPAFAAINWNHAKMLKVVNFEADEKDWFCFPFDEEARKFAKVPFVEKIKMDDWLEFFGYYITEGCTSKRAGNYRVLIAQDKHKNGDNYERIRACLQRLPFNFVDSFAHQFCITNKQLYSYLAPFGKSHEKYVPVELKGVSKRQLNILFDAMMLGDGSRKGDAYYSNSPKLISDFQELLLKIGYAGNIKITDHRKQRPVYATHILNRFNNRFRTPSYPNRTVQFYDGYVYCVNVPNHVIYVRRNGKALFCGNCYDEGKRLAETLMMDYHRQNNVDTRIVRIFNTYGPRMQEGDGRVVSNFIVQALRGDELTLYGAGEQTRSFCYVDDLVEGLIRLMNTEGVHDPVNIGNPREFTIRELAEEVAKICGSEVRIKYMPLPPDDPKQRQPDITRARELLNWNPTIELREGLARTVSYFAERLTKNRDASKSVAGAHDES